MRARSDDPGRRDDASLAGEAPPLEAAGPAGMATPSPEEVAALVAHGLSDAQLGRHFGRGDGWAYKFRRRHGIAPARPRPPAPDDDDVDAANRAYAVQRPSPRDEAEAAALFRRHGRRYEDVAAEDLAREGGRARRPALRNVTAAVCGDPVRGRRRR
jgi:hypothetical protein